MSNQHTYNVVMVSPDGHTSISKDYLEDFLDQVFPVIRVRASVYQKQWALVRSDGVVIAQSKGFKG